jgi:hypothetical protein
MNRLLREFRQRPRLAAVLLAVLLAPCCRS